MRLCVPRCLQAPCQLGQNQERDVGRRPHCFGVCPGPCPERGAMATVGWDTFRCQCPDVVPGIEGRANLLSPSPPEDARAASSPRWEKTGAPCSFPHPSASQEWPEQVSSWRAGITTRGLRLAHSRPQLPREAGSPGQHSCAPRGAERGSSLPSMP